MKALWKIALVLLAGGLAFIALGLSLGANHRGLYINKYGLNLSDENMATAKLTATEKVTEIEIDIISANIHFIIADDYGLEIYNNNIVNFEYSINNGKLLVKEKESLSFNIFNFNWKEEYVNIYLPQDATINSIVIRNTSGNLDATALKCETLNVHQLSGNMKMSEIQASSITVYNTSGDVTLNQVVAERFNINITSGNFRALNFETKDLKAKTLSGDISISGELNGNSDISVTSGRVVLELAGAEQDYNRNIKVTSGSVKINGKRDGAGHVDFKAANSLDISVTSGSVKLTFSK